uniref:rhamnan synthesis F family protein n=1 Tax=Candidatus Methylomirabilis sp. TaxID=2032687 RepID=UPI00307615BA
PDTTPYSPELFNISDIHPLSGDISSRVAVHAHVYYPDVITELASYLRNVPFAFDLFISVSTDGARETCYQAFSELPRAGRVVVDVVVNRGRDIAPMVCHFGATLATYDYICHVHTKKSVYTQGRMDGWREYLFRQLLGSEDQVRRIFSIFEKDPGAGIVYPQNYEHLPYWGNTWLSNRALGSRMCRQIGITDVPEGYFDYPAGSMFWARSKAIQKLFSADIQLTDFPEEAGQTDGSLAHCVERLLVLAVKQAGYKPLILADPVVRSWSKWRFDRYMARTVHCVKTMLDAQDVKVIAFDIFDTLLIRPVIHPETAKTIIGHRSRNMIGNDYAELRAHAEARARSRLGRDVGLDDIYAEFASLAGKQVDEVGHIRALEEDTELHLVAPRSECIDLANYAVRSGKRVVLVSDMFLPRGVVEKILSENGVTGYHALYLSSDIGVRKDTGELYRFVLQQEQIAPSALLMVGDNEHSDVQIPLNLGIQVCHVLRPVEIARALPRFSRAIEWVQTKGSLDEQLTLGLVIRKLFGPVFYQSLDPDSLLNGGPRHIGYAVVGPVIMSFCLWLIDTARKDGIEKLFFLAREGQLLKKVYDHVAMHVEDAIPSEYLVLSRRAVTVPVIESIDDIFRIAGDSEYFPNELHEFLKYRYGLTLKDDDLHELYSRGLWKKGELVEVKGDIRRLKPVLEALAESILARSRIERPGLTAYLDNIGLNDVQPAAVVDVGYSATIQGLLSGFLKKPIQGYYMLTSARSRENSNKHNAFARGYYADQIGRAKSGVSSLWRRSFELETLLSSNDPQVICYVADKNGTPEALYQEHSIDEQQSMRTRADIHRGVVSFVDDFFSLKNSVYPELTLPATLPEMLFGEFVEHMSSSEKEMLSSLALDDHYCGRGIVAFGQTPISGKRISA